MSYLDPRQNTFGVLILLTNMSCSWEISLLLTLSIASRGRPSTSPEALLKIIHLQESLGDQQSL